MDEERYEGEKKIFKNYYSQANNNNSKNKKEEEDEDEDEDEEENGDDSGERKALNYRLMTYDEIPSWFV